MADDNRYYETFYGIYTDDWNVNWGTLSSHRYLLVKDYLSDACSTTSDSTWGSTATVFLYPHHIKKTYYIEGVIEGHITFHAKSAYSYVSDYRISIVKISNSAIETTLATTGVITINDNIAYDATWHTGDDVVYPFWIDVFDYPKLITENERLGVKIEWNADTPDRSSTVTASLIHWNDSEFEDFKITIPFIYGD